MLEEPETVGFIVSEVDRLHDSGILVHGDAVKQNPSAFMSEGVRTTLTMASDDVLQEFGLLSLSKYKKH